jgi:hypothetical protein
MHQSFQPQSTNKPDPEFQPYQIVCLEHGSTYLYAEVVQIADGKQVCWVRPLALLEGTLEWTQETEPVHSSNLHDLRQSSDLFLPTALFRDALDTEVMPLLSLLPDLVDSSIAQAEFPQAQLNRLVKSVCLAHPELF